MTMVSMLAARSLLTLVTAILSCLPGVLLCRGCRLRSQLTWGLSFVNNDSYKNICPLVLKIFVLWF